MVKGIIYELTNPQKSIWDTEKFFKNSAINNICGSLTINEVVDFKLFEKAINKFIELHHSFHIRLFMDNGVPKQYFSKPEYINYTVQDIQSEEERLDIEREMVSTPFNIIESPLFEFRLFKFPNGHGGFVVNAHHIISDAATFAIIGSNIAKIYSDLKNNREIDTNIPSYIDYINSEQKYLASSNFKKDEEYWDNKFSTVPELASIPDSFKKTSNISSASKRISFILPKNTIEQIREVCSLNKFSVFNFLMSIYSLYIGRVSNLDDFVIGTPILNRTNFKEKHTSGMFISTVPLRIHINHDSTFLSFVSNMAKDSISMLRHQKYPYQFLLENLRKNLGNVPNLFDHSISYQITKTVDKSIDLPYSVHWIEANNIPNKINIHFHDNNDSGELIISYDYLVDRYSPDDISDTHERILYIIQQVLANINISMKDIEIITPSEKQKILVDFNNSYVNYPKNKTIVDLFEEQVSLHPNNTAVIFENQKLTYDELNKKANSLANYLIKSGVSKGSVIGLRLNKRFEMIIGILAIIKAGCCYLPINMRYPKDRVDYMLKDSNACLLLGTSESFSDMDFDIEKLNIELSEKYIYENDSCNLNIDISPEDLIYIIYTSGSTGKPKGAMLCHRNIVRLLKNDNFLFDFTENDTWTMFHSVAFDVSVWEMYGALLFGSKLVLVPDNVAQDPELFLNLLRKEKVTVLDQTPTYFDKLQKSELLRQDKDLKLRYIIYAGEALTPSRLKGWKNKYPQTKLINMYGITETTVHTTFKELSENDLESSSSNIGVPLPTLHVIIVDKNLNLMPFGVTGELCVLGEGVFKGYLNREDLNKTKLFMNKNYSDKLIYRSGDTAVLHKDGHLEYFGRIDTQVKVRGFRVELGEIEEKVLKYSNIETCIVTKKSDENGREMLCAYYIKNGPVNISNLRVILAQHLPDYMIPQYFVEIDKVPININGKTDFRALPLPHLADTKTEMLKPRNEIDEALIKIYQKILHIENISIADSFYDLGGDSLTAITISEAINQSMNIVVSVKDILEQHSISNLSDYISTLQSNKSEQTGIVHIKENEDELYPLSSAQKRIYYASKKISDNNLVYNTPGAIIINKILDKNKVENCFNTIINRHSSFRTAFVLDDEDVKQKIYSSVDFTIQEHHAKPSQIDDLIKNFPKPFKLDIAPLLRVELFYINDTKTILLFDSHHIIMDGTSFKILIKEFCDLYNGIDLHDLKIDYKDFSIWENKLLDSGEFKQSESYWIDKFKNSEISSLNLPYDFVAPSDLSVSGNVIYKKISDSQYKKYVDIANKLNISPYIFFLSAFFVFLYKYTDQNEIIIGSPTSGRYDENLNNIIGMFVNNLVLKANIDSNDSFMDFVSTIKNQVLNDLKYQNYPYNMLVKKLKTDSLFDVMFVYQSNMNKKISIDGQEAEIIESHPDISKFNLSIEIHPETHMFSFEYRTDLFKQNTIENMLEHFINVLNVISENTEINIKDISVLNEVEKNKILYDFNDNFRPYPSNTNLAKLFKTIVESNSENIAISMGDVNLTYRELDELSNGLAKKLLENGVTKDSIVGVCLKRSPELIVSIWAILKLSAIYMPIYTEFPKDRIDYMLKNSNAKLLITNTQNNLNFDVQTYLFDNITELEKCNELEVDITSLPDDTAYIIYTSGTTGNPKGVKSTHRNLINYVYALREYFGNNLSCKDSLLACASICFDASIFEFFLPILNGAKLVLYNEEVINDIFMYCDSIIKNSITTMFIPPNILNEVYNILKASNNLKLNKLLIGVESISRNTLNNLFKLNENMKIVNGYGPAETTICCTIFECEPDNNDSGILPIGSPLYNDQIYILNKDFQPQPIGIPGEIYVTGIGVGNGYLNNIEETNKRFLDNNFNNNSSKMYKTGDLGRWLPDGNIDFLGRNDSQIKISGHRIELDELNNTIMQYPNITKAFSTVKKEETHSFIVTYFTAENKIQINDLTLFLKNKLPYYMVPNFIIQLDSFPLTVNGKIDVSKLDNFFTKEQKQYVAPRNQFEEQIAKIFKKLFLLKKVGIDDNFFELGGDSLVAIKFQIEAMQLNIDISYADIFSFPTIRLLSERNIHNSKNISIKDYSNYDFSNINQVISINSLNNLDSEVPTIAEDIGNILLFGATGFLGAHILSEFLTKQSGIVYCLIRKKSLTDPTERLKKTLNFYFGDKYDAEFGKRIIVLTGDITSQNSGLSDVVYKDLEKNINIVINAAAIVKHYGVFKQFNDINIVGIKNIIEFCKKYNKKLYHMSTLSVSGNMLTNVEFSNRLNFKENNFYIGQPLDNLYVYTKFEAEKIIYEAISKGLNACVLRIGNLSNRYSDGIFQINASENAFLNRINSIIKLGVIPENLLEHSIDFTPVDICASAIVRLIQSNPRFTTFHLYNNNFVKISMLLQYLNSLNICINPISEKDFSVVINNCLKDVALKSNISGIITDLNNKKQLNLINNVLPSSVFSETYLKSIGFEWPSIDFEYIKKYIEYLKNI